MPRMGCFRTNAVYREHNMWEFIVPGRNGGVAIRYIDDKTGKIRNYPR